MKLWRNRLVQRHWKAGGYLALGLLFAGSLCSNMRLFATAPQLFTALSYLQITKADREYASQDDNKCGANTDISLNWYAPPKTELNSLDRVITDHGTHGFIFDGESESTTGYNYCNMPHVHPTTYPEVEDKEYHLEYVELIHRHHRRTPYADNTFPVENYEWNCDGEHIYYGAMATEQQIGSKGTYWQVYQSPQNPFRSGFNGTCQFPQMTQGGLKDSREHGDDIFNTYRHSIMPPVYHEHTLAYRVTNNPLTSHTGAFLMQGMWNGRTDSDTAMYIEPASIDSLEPAYPCKYADKLYGAYGPGSNDKDWLRHIEQSADLKDRLDKLSGVDPNDEDWSMSWDHYFDNLSSRLCHGRALPCKDGNATDCVTRDEADKVFRLGLYEYSYIYRDHPDSLNASVASFGIFISELAQNIRQGGLGEAKSSMPGTSQRMRYRHHIAHDGSIARLLSILQVNQMVWPGMGAEIAFEIYSKGRECSYVRVLWGGQILRSSHPAFGRMDMIPAETLLAYFDGLVGKDGSKIPGMCKSNPT